METLLSALSDLHGHVWAMAAAAIQNAQNDPAGAPAAVALAFALGMVHALTPGHGKSVVFSYFLGNGARLAAGVAVAMKIATLHVATAITLLLVVGATVQRFGRLQGPGRAMEIVSYAAVALMGAWLLYRAIAGVRAEDADSHGHRRSGALGYAIGLLPCPLTLILMNYALVNGTVATGLALTAVMACGIATTMTLVGALAILARRTLTSGLGSTSRWYGPTTRALEFFGAAVIAGVGATLFVRAAL